MKISENWLREHVNPPISTEELLEQLTNAGLEVEDCARVHSGDPNVVVGRVELLSPHPRSSNLTVCLVFDGSNYCVVVCGAPNLFKGMLTVLARVGATLENDLSIQEREIDGVLSNGMLCSESELGIGVDTSRIFELDQEYKAGMSFFDLPNISDNTIDIDLTPNRGDCFSVRGVARELAVINDLSYITHDSRNLEIQCDDQLDIQLDDPEACPLYLGRVIKNLNQNAETPLWIASKLRGCEIRPISPIVDIANFVMIETGQPLHSFDLEHVHNGIKVRKAQTGEQIVVLNGTEITLDSETLLITTDDKPVAIAGVIGGEESGIQSDTENLFLECAYFSPKSIAGTARKYGLQTDASTRYERGVDYSLAYEALERATELLVDTLGGEVGPVSEAVSDAHMPKQRSISLNKHRLAKLIGFPIPDHEVTRILQKLEFSPTRTLHEWEIKVPSHRFDIEIEEDLVEEICRIYGYNKITPRLPAVGLKIENPRGSVNSIRLLRRTLTNLGYQEVITYSFVDEATNDLFAPKIESPVLQNPMSEQRNVMQKSLLPGLVESLKYNLVRQQHSLKLFEYGQCFRGIDKSLTQICYVAGIATGRRHPESWSNAKEFLDFFDIKGDVETILSTNQKCHYDFRKSSQAFLHPGQSADIYVDDSFVGFFGLLNPRVENVLDLTQEAFVFEVNSERLDQNSDRIVSSISPYPSVRRDLALLVAKDVSAARIELITRDVLGDLLIDYRLFDLYEGSGIPSSLKSIAIGLILQDQSKTLTDESVNYLMDKVLSLLKSEVDARLR